MSDAIEAGDNATLLLGYDVSALYPCSAVLLFLGVVSMAGSALIIYLHLRFPSLRNDQHLIPGLAVADFFCGVGFVLTAVIPLMPAGTFTRSNCIWLTFPMTFGLQSGPAYTFVLSLMRYIGFNQPVVFARYRKAKYVISLHVVLVAYGTWPSWGNLAMGWGKLWEPVAVCVLDTVLHPLQTNIQITFSLITVAGIIVVNRKLWKVIKRQAVPTSTQTRRDQRLATSLITVSIVYICTFCATVLIYTAVFVFGDKEMMIIYGQFSFIPASFNSSVNIFIYTWRAQEYADALLYLVGKQKELQTETSRTVVAWRNRASVAPTC